MEVRQAMHADINDLVFERRNKGYGAYDIRRTYPKYVNIAMAIAIALLVVALFLPQIMAFFKPKEQVVEAPKVITTVTKLADAPSMENKPPPPQMKMPEPPKTVQFVAPKITTEQTNDEPPLDQQKAKEAPSVSTTTTEGEVNYEAPKENVVIETKKEPEFYEFADVYPEPPGGQANLVKYLTEHIQYPQMAIENDIQGKVYLYAVIEPDGSVGTVTKIKGIGGGCDEEAIRVVKNMPKWKPGIQNGKPIPVRVAIPVTFVLSK